ncbi:MAG: hypothetical protein PHC34_06510 [Candidatus Gastranaerophilales bacterium]|nr:hypothetical protein [Candidatus Gastranaerophilales bacterium]
MTPFPEQEPMAIKRIEVALKKRDWTLFKQGIIKISSMHESGVRWSDTDGWLELMNQAESDYIPPDLWEEFSGLTKSIIESIDDETINNPLPVYEEVTEETLPVSQDKIAIFYNQDIDLIQTSAIKKHKITLNNIMYNDSKYTPEPKWFEDLSRLVNNLDKPSSDMSGFLSLISLYKNSGTIITASYDANIVKNLVKSNIEFSLPNIKQIHGTDNHWEIYPLGGLCCSYICSKCGIRSVKTEFNSKTIVGSCSKCAGATYPDIVDISSETAEVNPKIWWGAFKRLSQASVWVLINPPSYNEKPLIKDLLKEAAINTEKIYIVTPSFEVSEWWKNKLSKLLPDAEIMNNFPNVTNLVSKLKTLPVQVEQVQTEQVQTDKIEDLSIVGL